MSYGAATGCATEISDLTIRSNHQAQFAKRPGESTVGKEQSTTLGRSTP